MERANWHTYQVLTKRSERMRDLLRGRLGFAVATAPHLVGRERRGPEARPAPRRAPPRRPGGPPDALGRAAARGPRRARPDRDRLGHRRRRERPGAGPMDRAWVASIRDQCRAAGVPFFFKQWGGTRKGRAGRPLDGVTHDEVPPRIARPRPLAGARATPSRRSRRSRARPWSLSSELRCRQRIRFHLEDCVAIRGPITIR